MITLSFLVLHDVTGYHINTHYRYDDDGAGDVYSDVDDMEPIVS